MVFTQSIILGFAQRSIYQVIYRDFDNIGFKSCKVCSLHGNNDSGYFAYSGVPNENRSTTRLLDYPKSFFFSKCLEADFFLLKICLIFCGVFPFKSCNFDVFSQNVSEFLSEVSDFSGSSFPKMAKKAFGATSCKVQCHLLTKA